MSSGDNQKTISEVFKYRMYCIAFSNIDLHLKCLDERLLEVFKNKTVMVSWLVSNCNDTKSPRNQLVERLREHGIEVTTYGGCGIKVGAYHEAWEISGQAKFYFAFENSLCTDYVTEKLFSMFPYDTIPVSFSGGE
jgi:alpha-1,3-fucosyltransferase